MHVFKNKDYVVVHMKKTLTSKNVVYFVVPNAKHDYFTKIGRGRAYDLRPDRYTWVEKGRKHYIRHEWDFASIKFNKVDVEAYKPVDYQVKRLDEEVIFVYGKKLYFRSSGDGVPMKLDPRTEDDYVFGSDEVQGGMDSESMRILHKPKDNLIWIIVGIGFLVMALVIVYGVMEYQKISPLVETIYSNTVVNHQVTNIAPAPTGTPTPGK